MKVRPRAFAIALVLLLALDLVARLPIALPVPRDFRLPDRTLMGYDQYVAAMKRDDGVRVAVIGDSVAQGAFAEPDQTLSAWLNRRYANSDRDVHVYNFGMAAAHANDLLPLVADLTSKGAVDLVLVNFDYRFYRGGSTVRRYPELYDKVADFSPLEGSDLLKLGKRVKSQTPQQRGDAAVGRVWALFGLRDYIAAVSFGDRPSAALWHEFLLARAASRGRPFYGKKSPEKLNLAALRTAYHVPKLTRDNVDVRYFAGLLDVAAHDRVPVVVWVGPVDSSLLDTYDIWDRTAYARDMAFARDLSREHGAQFVDMTFDVPREHLADSHHPLAAGYADLAVTLGDAIDPTVREIELRRGGQR